MRSSLEVPKKQRHTAKRIHVRLCGTSTAFDGGYTIVKDYVREHRRLALEMFVPLAHPDGHAQCNFGEAWAVIGEVRVSSNRLCCQVELGQRQLFWPLLLPHWIMLPRVMKIIQ